MQIKLYDFPEDKRLTALTNIKQVQTVILRMLKVLKIICNLHSIDFWLEYGTLLGAIRHKGFIPWDHEADVGMLREDFEKFKKLVYKDLPQDIFFQTKYTDSAYEPSSHYIEAKLRDKYSNYIEFENANPHIKWHNGIQVDIFVYDPVELNGEICLINAFEKVITGVKSYLKIIEIEELEEFDFEDTKFFVPIGYDNYLKRNYGNYLQLPPIEEQKLQFVDILSPCIHKEVLKWDRMK